MSHLMDETDRQIVGLLQKDGRTSNVEMARELGLAEGTVRKRIERLLSSGVMQIMAIVDPARVGYPTRVLLGLEADLTQLDAIVSRLSAIPQVLTICVVTGVTNVLIEVVFPSEDHLLAFLLDKVATIPGVKRTETFRILKQVKRAYEWSIQDDRLGLAGPSKLPDVLPGTIVVSS